MTFKNPKVEPIKIKDYHCKQSEYELVPKLPMRSMIVAPSGGGKTVLLQNMILNIYKGCFDRIYIFSPSVEIDDSWTSVKTYIKNEIKPHEKEKIYFDSYEPDELSKIIEKQHKVINYLKTQNYKKMFQILIIIDDWADDPQFTRQSKLLHQLYIRGRHQFISTITSTQVYKAISPLVRKNMTHLFIYRLRNYADLQAIIEEMSAIYTPKMLLKMYEIATNERYSFLYINLMENEKEKMFYIRFDKRLIPKQAD